eukprot:scaffold317066_cov19-Prasinocladus_malaysianus.AAC.1
MHKIYPSSPQLQMQYSFFTVPRDITSHSVISSISSSFTLFTIHQQLHITDMCSNILPLATSCHKRTPKPFT